MRSYRKQLTAWSFLFIENYIKKNPKNQISLGVTQLYSPLLSATGPPWKHNEPLLNCRPEAHTLLSLSWQTLGVPLLEHCCFRDFSGGLVVKTLLPRDGGAGLIPGQGTEIPYASCGQKIKINK